MGGHRDFGTFAKLKGDVFYTIVDAKLTSHQAAILEASCINLFPLESLLNTCSEFSSISRFRRVLYSKCQSPIEDGRGARW